MVARLTVLIGLLLATTLAFSKGLTARVDRTQLGLGEQLELTLVMSDIQGQRPDTRELLQDFSIDRQSQSSNYQIINGVVNQEASWTFLLSPNRKGKLMIPSFTVGRFSSDPIDITVTDMPVAQSTSDDVLMEVEVSPANPYIQSQVAYIQRLYFSRPLVDSASISRPKLSKGDADIQFWGSSDPRYVTHNNRPYQLIERYYLVYPRTAGALEFEPSVFNGSLAMSQQRNDFRMNMFKRGTRVNAYSEKVSLDVREKPDSYLSEHWLPASQLTLNMNLSHPANSLKAGEPLTVTIALMAEGLKAEVLPEVKLDLPDNLKSYPEKPTFRTDKITNGMVGLRQEKVVLIANQAGEYTIPAIEVPWWSVTEDKLKIAKLDAMVLKVAAVEGAVPPPSNTDPGVSGSNEPAGDEKSTEQTNTDNASGPKKLLSDQAVVSTFWSDLVALYQQHKKAVLISTGTAVGLLGIIWLAVRRRKKRLVSPEYQNKLALTEARNVFAKACKQNDPKLAIEALPNWAKAVGIFPATMAGVEQVGDDALSAAIRELATANYSADSVSWNGTRLLDAITQYGSTRTSSKPADQPLGLKPLHPLQS